MEDIVTEQVIIPRVRNDRANCCIMYLDHPHHLSGTPGAKIFGSDVEYSAF